MKGHRLLSGNPEELLQQSAAVDKMRQGILAVVLGLVGTIPARASALPDAEVGVACGWLHGPGGRSGPESQVMARYGLADDWDLFLRTSLAVFPGRRVQDLVSVAAGTAFVLDAARWSPSLFAGIGYQGPLFRGDQRPSAVVLGGIQMDLSVLPGLRVGLGLECRLPLPHRDDLPWMASGSLRFLWGRSCPDH